MGWLDVGFISTDGINITHASMIPGFSEIGDASRGARHQSILMSLEPFSLTALTFSGHNNRIARVSRMDRADLKVSFL